MFKQTNGNTWSKQLRNKGGKNDDSRNFCIFQCRKIIKQSSAWCMSMYQLRLAMPLFVVVKFSSLEHPLKSWSPPISHLLMSTVLLPGHWSSCFPSQGCYPLHTGSAAGAAGGGAACARQGLLRWEDANNPTSAVQEVKLTITPGCEA